MSMSCPCVFFASFNSNRIHAAVFNRFTNTCTILCTPCEYRHSSRHLADAHFVHLVISWRVCTIFSTTNNRLVDLGYSLGNFCLQLFQIHHPHRRIAMVSMGCNGIRIATEMAIPSFSCRRIFTRNIGQFSESITMPQQAGREHCH